MAELTSGLTSVVFSPYSKMFIGGLSWQTSPGETVILFYTVFLVVLSLWLSARCSCWRCMCECALCSSVTVWDISLVCAHDVIFDLRPSEVLYSTPMRIAGCFWNAVTTACPYVSVKWPDMFSLFTDSLRDYFSKFGEIRECMVMRDPTTKRSR